MPVYPLYVVKRCMEFLETLSLIQATQNTDVGLEKHCPTESGIFFSCRKRTGLRTRVLAVSLDSKAER